MGLYDSVLDEEEQRLQRDAQSAARNDSLDAVLDAEQAQNDGRLRASLTKTLWPDPSSSPRVSPDVAARQSAMARQAGVPVAVVERNFDEVAWRERVRELQSLARSSPVLARQLSDYEFARIAHDDAEQLSLVEKGIGYLRKGGRAVLSGFVPTFNAAAYGVAQMGGEALSKYLTGPLAGRILPVDLGATIAELAKRHRTDQERFAKDLRRDEEGVGFVERSVYSGLSSLGTSLVTTPVAIATGQPQLALYSISAVTGGQEFGKARDAGRSFEQSVAYAASQAVIEYATEKLPMSRLIGDLKAGTPFYRMLVRQVAAEVPGEQIATVLQDLNEWAVIHPDKPFSDYIRERPSAAAQTLIATLVAVGGQTTIAKAVENAATRLSGERRPEQGAQDAAALRQLEAVAAASKVRERDPDAFARFVDDAAAQVGAASEVYVDARTFVDALNQSGLDVAKVSEAMPSVREQLQEALASEGDLRIPLGEFAARISGTPAAAELLQHVRTDPHGMSEAESQAFFQDKHTAQALQDEVKRLADEIAALDANVKQTEGVVRQHVMSQLKATGRFTDQVNSAYSDLVAAFYNTMAQRLGESADALLQRYPLHIVSQLNLSGPGILAQAVPHPDAVNSAEQLAGYAKNLGMTPDAVVNAWTAKPPAQGTVEGSFWQAFQSVRGAALEFAKNPEALAAAKARLHQAQQNARGAFDPSTSTIALLAHADLSTFLHEAGHFYLEVLTDIAARPNTPQAVKDDVQALMRWFGVSDLVTWSGMALEQKRAFHEKFARGFEAYLFEGESPNLEMSSLFQRFRAWLIHVYKSLVSLNVELSDEVRGVFNRMLATDEQISATEAARNYRPIFENAETAGMSLDQWTEYQRLGGAATAEAKATLERRGLQDMQWLANAKSRKLRELQAKAAAKRAAVKREAETLVYAEPVYRAMRFITHGELVGSEHPNNAQREILELAGQTGTKLSLPALKDMYGGGAAALWRYLPTGQYGMATAEDGMHPDVAAELFGFPSGDALVRALLAADKPKDAIGGVTDRLMLERYGDLTDQAALERAAEAAIHNDTRARFLSTELTALGKATGRPRLMARAARAFAEAAIAEKRIQAVRPAQYAAAEARAARNAERALKGGKTEEAAAHKQAQLVNHQLEVAADKALDEVDVGVAYLRKFNSEGTRHGLDADYLDQIDQLLERYDLRPSVSNRELRKRESLRQWVEAQREQGFEPTIDDDLLNEANHQHYREMRMQDFRGLVDAVKNIEHLGRLKKKLLTAQDDRDFSTRVAEAAESIRDNAKRELPQQVENNRWRDRMKQGANEFFAWHRKLSSLVREMDGHKDGGVLWELIVRPMNHMGDQEAVEREKATLALAAIFEPILKGGNLRTKMQIPGTSINLSREGRLMVALNWGNDINRQRVMAGDGWNQHQVQAILNTLTKQEWDFVQAVWDRFDSYWPRIAEKERRVSGVPPQKVQASAVQTPYGEYRGGYFPIKYDPQRSSKAEADTAAEFVTNAMRGLYTRATTRRGHTKERIDEVHGRPLRKDFGVVFEHVDQVIHDLAWHEFLIDVNRLLRAKPLDQAIRAHYGPEVLRAMRKMVEDIAMGETPAQNVVDRALNAVRHGATVAGLGWRLTTSLLQPIGLTQSMVRIGPKWVGKGMARWLADAASVENTAAWITERSDFMRLRAKTMQREINEIRNRVGQRSPLTAAGVVERIAGEKPAEVLEASYFYLITKMQLVADIPTWLGQYEKSMAAGEDEARAIALADQAVLDAQGGGQVKDLANVQKGSAAWKLWTNFYSFFNTTWNLSAEAVNRTNFKKPGDVALLAVDFLLLYSVPAALGTILKAALKGDDDDKFVRRLIADQLTYLLGTLVLVREASAGAQAALGLTGYDYSGPASVRLFGELAKLAKQVEQGEADTAFWKTLNNAAGTLFHYPAGQISNTVEGAIALGEDQTKNPGALLVGPPR